jgi:O-acetyl-ADP-ribose deacetylase (regulator of RNase III)
MTIVIDSIVASITSASVGAHAIVDASNPEVGLGSGVSGAIREACGGAAYQKEIRERLEEEFESPLAADDCLVTGPGTASAFRWVLHVAAVNYRVPDSQTGGASGPTRVAKCTRAALEEAARLAREAALVGTFVLGTPLLGAGHGGLGVVVSLDAMMGAVNDWLHDCPEDRETISRIVFAVLADNDARLVGLAAAKHGLPVSRQAR